MTAGTAGGDGAGRDAGRRPPQPWRHARAQLPTLALVVLASLVAAVLAARVDLGGDHWLWNLDMPKIDFPFAVLAHDALAAGRLPLWDDRLGLGFPLYAEGQIGAFYPPNWALFQLEPLAAMDASRVVHLAWAGIGAGLLAVRIGGAGPGAAVAALVAVAGGAITAKLEWWNLVAAYAWLPWVLLPLARRPAPTAAGVAAAGILWGFQALAGHPNTWLLTGLAAGVLLLARAPRPSTLARIVAFAALGAAVGAVQLLPTLLLSGLSVRSAGLSSADLFASAATLFDPLGLGFANAFARGSPVGWDWWTTWYPDGFFALLEAFAYVGLPVLVLAAAGIGSRRARPWLVVAAVMLAIPIVAALEPGWWQNIPVLSQLRSPTRSYLVVALVVGLVAALGLREVGRAHPAGGTSLAGDGHAAGRARSPARRRIAGRRGAVVLGVVVAWYALIAGLAVIAPSTFVALVRDQASFGGLTDEQIVERAVAALTAPLPLLAELAVGIAAVALVLVARRGRRGLVVAALLALAAWPLLALSPAANRGEPLSAFSYANRPIVRALAASNAHRVFAFDAPGWWEGVPDQLAAAGVRDLRMFSSLNLEATEALTARVDEDGPGGTAARAAGIDVAVVFDRACPGPTLAQDGATRVCRLAGATRPPYWVPDAAVSVADRGESRLPTKPLEASVDLEAAAAAVPALDVRWDDAAAAFTIDAPAAGWVWIDRAWWPAWRTTVDSVAQEPARALGGQLVRVGAGRHRIDQALDPWEARLGLAAGVAAVVAVAAFLLAMRLRSRGRLRRERQP